MIVSKSSGNRHPIYQAWISLRYRCNNPVGRNSCYKYVGYDQTWESFEVFLEDMGSEWSSGLTIDRTDSTKGYSKDNCRWVDMSAQANNKSSNRKITFNGVTKNLNQWSDELGIKRTTISQRLDQYGWSVIKTLTTKPRERRILN